MNDQYNVGQAGAVGPGSHAHDMTFNQIWQKLGSEIPLAQLPSQLSALRHEMKKAATEPDQDIAVAEVAKAEIAAKAGDGPTVLKALKSAGNWALEIAKKIGVELAAKLIMAAIESPGA